MSSIGEALQAKKSREVAPGKNDVSIFLQLVAEQKHPLDLVRELVSNAGSSQVGATKIEISYTRAKEGHIFEVSDNGCGMSYTGSEEYPGRLDKFLGLGLSSIVGMEGDEFSWKGLGSKLAYQSRRVEIESCAGAPNPEYDVKINEPWETLHRREIPKAKISEHPAQSKGTRIQVIGHPPHDKGDPFTFDDIRSYVLHRTFAGFTRDRLNPPQITLSVLGKTEELPFGFSEFRDIDFGEIGSSGLKLDRQKRTLLISVEPKSHASIRARLKGFLTWNPSEYGLSDKNRNTGLILAVKGIPYFELDLEEYGATSIPQARPGRARVCLVLECDAVHDVMNIARSGLVNHPKTDELKSVARELFRQVETSDLYLGEGGFRRLPEEEKFEAQGEVIAEEKRKIELAEQTWVVLDRAGEDPVVLLREPKSEMEVNALLWKLEALQALPFETFQTLAYIGAAKGPDLLVNFQEDKSAEASRAAVVEVELNFYNYKTHGHTPPQYPKVVCWDAPTSGRKAKIEKTKKAHKYFLPHSDGYTVQIFVIKNMEGIKVLSRDELAKRGVRI